MPMWSEKVLGVVSALNVLRLVLWPSVVSLMESVPRALEKNVNRSETSVKSTWSGVSCKAAVSWLMFCPEEPSTGVNGVLMYLAMTVFLSVSPLMSIKVYFTYLGASMLGA